MSSRFDRILKGALSLESSERSRLIAELMASMNHEPGALDSDWLLEINQRADRVISGESHGEPWSVVRERLEVSLKKR